MTSSATGAQTAATKPTGAVLQDLQARNLLELVDRVRALRGVCLTELCGRTRTQNVVAARHEIWWLIRNHPDRHYSLQEIARIFGNNHATVWAGLQAHQRRLLDIGASASKPQA
jgi:chromosomal replication initiation ATPase DnaA